MGPTPTHCKFKTKELSLFMTVLSYAQAGGKGVEPLHTDSESAVLPLDEPPPTNAYITTFPPFLTRVFPEILYPGCAF